MVVDAKVVKPAAQYQYNIFQSWRTVTYRHPHVL